MIPLLGHHNLFQTDTSGSPVRLVCTLCYVTDHVIQLFAQHSFDVIPLCK